MNELDISSRFRDGRQMTLKEKTGIVAALALPGMLAQITEIVMQYIDAAMVGSLGASASASIGLVSSSTWLFGGLLGSCAAGFSVQVAHACGAGDYAKAKSIFRQSLGTTLCFAVALSGVGCLAARVIPAWLGGEAEVVRNATLYFTAFALFIPVRMLNGVGMNMLQCSGNMKVPSMAVSLTCLLDVVFNFFLIFPSRTLANGLFVPGAGLGVLGAQLGTSLSFLVCMCIVMYYAVLRSKVIGLKGTTGSFFAAPQILKQALKIGVPMAMENSALCAAQVVGTKIVAPLGTAAIAANSFAITAESICYMPGFGISSAATTLIGQSLGAKRKDLAVSFAWLSVFSAMAVMSLGGFGMYFLCPYVFAFLTPVQEVRDLGIACLRIELFAEPLFAASIAATGALRGAKDTLVPGIMNLISIWGVRLTTSFFLTRRIGLRGAWIAMAAELCFRGILFLIRLKRGKWLEKA